MTLLLRMCQPPGLGSASCEMAPASPTRTKAQCSRRHSGVSFARYSKASRIDEPRIRYPVDFVLVPVYEEWIRMMRRFFVAIVAAMLLAGCESSTVSSPTIAPVMMTLVPFAAGDAVTSAASPTADGVSVTGTLTAADCENTVGAATRTGAQVSLSMVRSSTKPPAGTVCDGLVRLYHYQADVGLPSGSYHLTVYDTQPGVNGTTGSILLDQYITVP
jgi:hypothetical protein